MPEQLDLTTPIVASRNNLVVQALTLDWTNQVISVRLLGSDGNIISAIWTGAPAVALMSALNTINLSVKSLQKRILEQLVTDGKLTAGTVSGVPS